MGEQRGEERMGETWTNTSSNAERETGGRQKKNAGTVPPSEWSM